MDHSTPGLPVHHQLPELAQTHVHRVGDAVQPSHPLSAPSPPAFHLSEHQGLFQWVGSFRGPKHWSFSFSISPSKPTHDPNLNITTGKNTFRASAGGFFTTEQPGKPDSVTHKHMSKVFLDASVQSQTLSTRLEWVLLLTLGSFCKFLFSSLAV